MDNNEQKMKVYESEDGTVTIVLPEKFNFDSHTIFRNSYADYPVGRKFILDFSRVAYIDSSALGMLLLMKEHVSGIEKKSNNISFIGCMSKVAEIFKIANFNRLFEIK